MIDISDDLQSAFNAYTREIHTKVTLNFSDVTLDPSIAVISSRAIDPDFTEQVINGNTVTPSKWLSMDGIGDMGGTYAMQPVDTDRDDLQVGYWSDTIGDVDGVIDAGFYMTSSARNISTFNMNGDNSRMEYPVDLEIRFYDENGLVDTVNITDNEDLDLSYEFDTELTDITIIQVDITKWSEPLTNAKVIAFYTSLTRIYTDSNIISFDVTEESEISNDNSVPTGNISYSSCNLSLVNEDREFDINNTSSSLYGNIKPNTKIDIQLGARINETDIEYFDFFSGWTGDFSASDNSMEVTTTAYDRLERLGLTNMSATEVLIDYTAGDLAEYILNDYGLSEEYIDIDVLLYESEYTVPVFFIDGDTHLAELTRLSEAFSMSVFCISNVITINSIEALSYKIDTVETFTRSDYTDKTNESLYDSLINSMTVPYASYSLQSYTEVYSEDDEDIVDADGDTTLTFTLDESACVNHVLTETLPTGVTITEAYYYSDRAVITFNNTNLDSQIVSISISAQYYEKGTERYYETSDADSILDYGLTEYTYSDNDLLQTSGAATTIGDYMIEAYKDPFRDVSVTLTNAGNPAVSLTDRFGVTDRYTTKKYNMVSKNTSYTGGLSMTVKGRITALRDFNLIDNNDNQIIDHEGNEIIVLLSGSVSTYTLIDNNANEIVTDTGYNIAIGGE